MSSMLGVSSFVTVPATFLKVDLPLGWLRGDGMSEAQQLVSHSGHCGDYRHYPAALALCLEDPLRHVTNSFRRSNGSAAVFLNYQAHVQIETNSKGTRTAILFEVGYSSIARRTSVTVAAIG